MNLVVFSMDVRVIGKLLILLGLILALSGAFLMVLGKLPSVGRLPGDIHIQKRAFSFHFPLTTCLFLSIILTILLRIFLKR